MLAIIFRAPLKINKTGNAANASLDRIVQLGAISDYFIFSIISVLFAGLIRI